MRNADVSVVIAGEAGQGIQSIESLLALLAKKASYNVFATKEYMSRVRGGCNSTEIRVSPNAVRAPCGRIDILIPLIPAAIAHLKDRITDDTVVIGEKGSIGLDAMEDVPFSAMAMEAGGALYANTVAVGTLCAILGFDRAACEGGIRAFFGSKALAVQDANVVAFGRGYDAGVALKLKIGIDMGVDRSVAEKIMVTGAEAIALGAIAGGCNYVCAYPMSPGTTVLTAMADYLDHGGRSRGSVLYTDPAGGLPVWQDADANPVDAGLDERFRFVPDDGALDGVAQIVTLRPGPGAKPPDPHHAGSDHVPQPAPAEELPAVECRWRPVRPLPNPDEPFEVVWRGYLADRNVH